MAKSRIKYPEVLGVRLPSDVMEQFVKLAEDKWITPSQFARMIIVNYVNSELKNDG